MKHPGSIIKIVGSFIIAAVFYMHLCSAFCATASVVNGKENTKRSSSCCSHKKTTEKKKDCQSLHFSFFSTTGQYAKEKSEITPKSFPAFIAVLFSLFTISSNGGNEQLAFNSFHPPRPDTDIKVLIRSLQI